MRVSLPKFSPLYLTWGLAAAVLMAALVFLLGDFGWRYLGVNGTARMWKRGYVYQLDANGDGLVDEEINYHGPGGKVEVRKDTHFDGYFDLRYNLGKNGIAYNLQKIHEKAPRRGKSIRP